MGIPLRNGRLPMPPVFRPFFLLLLAASALTVGAGCQRPPRTEPARGEATAGDRWGLWSPRPPREWVPADLEGLDALAHAVGTVLDELEPTQRDRILAPLWPYGPPPPLEGPDVLPSLEVWRADELVLRDVLGIYREALGTDELAVAALFLGPDALSRARRPLRKVAPERITLQRLRPHLKKRMARQHLGLAEEAVTRAVLFGLTWPVERTWRITSPFGPRWHPVRGVPTEHRGVDIATPEGTVITAVMGGRVRRVAEDRVNGKWLELDHGRGVISQYMHLHEVTVKRGQRIEAGEPIALSGATGRVTGPHLHYQVKRDAVHVDPVSFRLSADDTRRAVVREATSGVGGSPTAMP